MPKPELAEDLPTDERAPALPDRVRLHLLEQQVSALHLASTELVLGQKTLATKLDLVHTDLQEREKNARERVERICGHISRGIEAFRKVALDFKPGVYLIILAAVARLLAGVVETLDIDGWGSVDFVDKTDLPRDAKAPRPRETKAPDSDPEPDLPTHPEPTP